MSEADQHIASVCYGTEGTNSSKILCLMFVYVLLFIYNICKFMSGLILWFYGNLWFDDLCEE